MIFLHARTNSNSSTMSCRVAQQALVTLWLLAVSSTAGAQAFFDDFEDGDAVDGMPIRWSTAQPGLIGSADVEAGALILESESTIAIARAGGISLNDTSIRTLAQLIDDGGSTGAISVIARNKIFIENGGYIARIDQTGEAMLGILQGNRIDALAIAPTDLDVLDDLVIMQLDAIGDTVQFWAWSPDDLFPSEPLLSVTDNRVSAGTPAVVTFTDVGPIAARFEFVRAESESLPAPSRGDLNADGLIDSADIEMKFDPCLKFDKITAIEFPVEVRVAIPRHFDSFHPVE